MEISSTLIDTFQRRKQRWLDFYDSNQPASSLFLIHYLPGLGERPFPREDNVPARIDWAIQKYEIMLNRLEWLEDDSLPFLDAYTGTEIFAAAFGCPVQYPADNMPFALPLIHGAEEIDRLPVPSLDVPPIARLFTIADELRRRAGPEALLRLVDIQSPMDIAALIWDKLSFYPALVQNPGAALALAHKVKTFLTQFLDEWFARYGRAFIAHYPDYYMPFGLTLSEDEVGAVSGAMFDSMFLPELVELSERYGGLGMHCCAHARHQWKNFLKIPDLRLLNLVQPPAVTQAAVTYFSGHVAQFPSYCGEGPAWTWPAQHPPQARMVYEVTAASRQEALEISEKMHAVLSKDHS